MSLPDIVEDTELLKLYPDQALVREIQNPTGSLGGRFIPTIFITSELKNRQRIRNEQKRREAQDMPTVAEEVVMAAGVPQQGIMQMAKNMAPKTNMGQNTGMADMMPKQPTMGMSGGGIVKMQPGGMMSGAPTREVVFEGRRYVTDGSGRVFEAARRGSMRRGREVTDPDVISAVIGTGPGVASDVGGLASLSENLDTLNPMSEGITPVQTPESMFTTGNQMPLVASTDVQPNRFTDLPQQPLVKDKNFTLRPYEGPMPQSDVRGIGDVGGFNLDTLPSEKSDPITEVQTPDGVFTDGMFVGQDTKKESRPNVQDPFDRKDIPPNLLSGMPTRDETLLQDLIAQNQALIPGTNVPRQQTFLDNQPQTPEELIQDQEDPSTLEKRGSLRRSIFGGINFEDAKEKAKELIGVGSPQQTFLDNQPQTTEELIEGLDEQDKNTSVNKAAEVVLAEVGKETLAAASGAQGPQAAAQAQQGFSDKQWLDIAALGMMISSGNPADLREASKLFIKLQEASRGRKSKEKMAAADRASREKIADARSRATQANTEARIRSAALNRDFRVLDSIETRLQDDIIKLMPLNPKDPVAPQNKDAVDALTRQLKEVRKAIEKLGTFDLGPGSGETEIAGSYNVVGT